MPPGRPLSGPSAAAAAAAVKAEPPDDKEAERIPDKRPSDRLLERLAKENMQLRSALEIQKEETLRVSLAMALGPHMKANLPPPPPPPPPPPTAAGGPASSSSGPSAGPAAPTVARPKRQSGAWPSKNDNVARYKRQDVSPETRIRLDIRNEKKRRKREEKRACLKLAEVGLLTF